jgi:hypothetical protein
VAPDGPTSVHTEERPAQTQGDGRFGEPEKRDSWFDPPMQKKEAILQECICHENASGRMLTLAYGQIYLQLCRHQARNEAREVGRYY